MSFYSSGAVKTHYLDAKSFIDGRRAVFEIDRRHTAVLPKIRLIDVGGFGAQVNYGELVGGLGLIESVTLYDGKNILSQRRKFGLHRGFQAQNMKNSVSQSKASRRSLNQMGYKRDNLRALSSYREPNTDGHRAEVARADSNGASLDLRECLSFLNNIEMLPTDMFQNLRVEVDFDNSPANGMYATNNAAIAGQLIPFLAIDVIDDKKIVANMMRESSLSKGVQWLEVEHDQVLFPQSANNGAAGDQALVQEVSFKLDAFKNKFVERLLQVKEYADNSQHIDANAVKGFGKFGSYAFFNESIQYRLNGVNVLPDSGATGNMERLYHVTNVFGDCLCYPGSNQVDLAAGTRGQVGPTVAVGNDKTGNLSYNAIAIMDRVQDLQVTHSRTGLEDTAARPSKATTNAMNLHFFGEVKKAFVPQKNGSYLIAYL